MTTYLPVEILNAIFEEVDDVRDLWHVRTVSRTLCAAATPIAFRVLSVITTRRSARNLGQLFDVPDIAAHVREVVYHDTGTDRRGRMLKYVRTSAVHELASSFSRIHQLPRLETVNLTFYPANHSRLDSDGGGPLALQTSILGALEASFSIRVPPSLTSLSLHNLRTSDLLSLESPSFQTALMTLQRLQLSVLFDPAPDPYACWCHFWSTLLPRMILAPTQHALSELTLHCDEHVGASSGLSLAGLHFPHLCALSLLMLVFEPSVGVEDFVLRHAPTLARLEFLSCKLTIPAGTSLPLAQDEQSSIPLGGWARIWDRFAVELTSLVTLHVDGRSLTPWDYAGPVCRYVAPGPGISFWEMDAFELHNAADIAALRRFHTTVATRSEETRNKF